MNEKRIYRICLALPLIVPVGCVLVLNFLIKPLDLDSTDSLFRPVGVIMGILVYAGLIAGIPYVLLAVSLLIWMRDKDVSDIRRALLLSPLIFILYFSVFGLIIFAVTEMSGEGVFSMFILLTIFIVPVGYFYVLITFGIARLFRKQPFN